MFLIEQYQELWRKSVFLVGKIRRLPVFPWVTWAVEDHSISYDEISEALPLIQFGDVGLHRYSGYLANLAISGFMIHAWVHTEQGMDGKIVEAVSEGVLHRSPFYGMYADYTIILRPKEVTELERKGACKKAKQIIGSAYDVNFKFDIGKELAYFRRRQGGNEELAKRHLEKGQPWIQKYHPAFTCTEVAAYSWWHRREALGIKRTKLRGKSVILGDTFLNPGWNIVWASKTVTADSAKALGLSGAGLDLIADYRRQHPVKK